MSASITPIYVHQIKRVYAAIARQVEELIFLLNEAQESNQPKTRELADKINVFLSQLEKSVRVEGISAKRTLSNEKKNRFLRSIKSELDDIKELEAFIELAKRRPTSSMISKINQLYKAIEREIDQQEELAA
ncbi:hypothetical protein J4444_01585 [Candidatus Woesearchaeota archaeon]|nr:hypothetical protein [Candidatus Woesearchaeota archaeon]